MVLAWKLFPRSICTSEPSVSLCWQAAVASTEADGCKLIDSAKDRSPIQRSKGSLGNVGLQGSKSIDAAKGNSGAANCVFSQRYRFPLSDLWYFHVSWYVQKNGLMLINTAGRIRY